MSDFFVLTALEVIGSCFSCSLLTLLNSGEVASVALAVQVILRGIHGLGLGEDLAVEVVLSVAVVETLISSSEEP